MKLKQVLILGSILIVLIVAVFLKRFQKPAELTTQEYVALDLSFDSAKINALEISKGNGTVAFTPAKPAGKEEKKAEEAKQAAETIRLVKENGEWKVASLQNARGDQEKIDRFLKTIQSARGEVRGKSKALFPDFGIEDEKAIRVKLKAATGKDLLDLSIGIKKAGGQSFFIRKAPAELVYLTDANILGDMGIYGEPDKENPAKDFWVSGELVKFEVPQVSKIEAARFVDGKPVVTASVLRQTDSADQAKKKWSFVRSGNAFSLDAEKIKEFLSSFQSWRAQKAVDPNAKDYGFSKPIWKMTLGLDGGKEITLTATAKDTTDNVNYIQVSGEPVVYQLSPYYFENMDIDDSRFYVENPLLVSADKTTKLVIHTDKKELSFNPKAKKWESLTAYLTDLSKLRATKLLFNGAEQKKARPGAFWVEIQGEGEPTSKIMDVGEMISTDTKEYAARLRGDTQAFSLSETIFKQLFDNLDRLTEPPPPPAPAAPATPPAATIPQASKK